MAASRAAALLDSISIAFFSTATLTASFVAVLDIVVAMLAIVDTSMDFPLSNVLLTARLATSLVGLAG